MFVRYALEVCVLQSRDLVDLLTHCVWADLLVITDDDNLFCHPDCGRTKHNRSHYQVITTRAALDH
jgi:hypothetical protein